jgi:hypothetical protein
MPHSNRVDYKGQESFINNYNNRRKNTLYSDQA